MMNVRYRLVKPNGKEVRLRNDGLSGGLKLNKPHPARVISVRVLAESSPGGAFQDTVLEVTLEVDP